MSIWGRRRARHKKLVAIIDQASRQTTLQLQAEQMIDDLDALVSGLHERLGEIT